MGAWGYKQMQSDNGLDTIGSAVSYMIKENHGILDIDKAYKDEISTLSHPQNYGSNIPDWRITDACISYAEVIYYFSTNKQDEELWYKVCNKGAALNDMKAVVSSRKALQYITNKVKDYRRGELKTFESSGWFEQEVYNQRCQWVDLLIKNIDSLIAKANADRVVIWDRSKAPISLVGYSKAIKITDDHDLNRLRLFLANEINPQVRHGYPCMQYVNIQQIAKVSKSKEIVADAYWTAETYIGSQGKLYKLIFHDEANRQKTIAKSKSVDSLIGAFRERRALDGVTVDLDVNDYFKECIARGRPNIDRDHVWKWENWYNRLRYVAYFRSILRGIKA